MSHEKQSGGLFRFFRKGGEDVESHEPLSEEVIHQWLVQRLAKQVKLNPSAIDTAQNFELYGLDSIAAVRISGELEKLVEQRLSPALLFEYPNIDALSTHLAGELGLKAIA